VQLGEEFAEIILVGVVVADYRGAVARICSLCTLLNTPTKMVGTTHVSPGGEVKTIAIAVTRAAVVIWLTLSTFSYLIHGMTLSRF
jgi:hypothetical protein